MECRAAPRTQPNAPAAALCCRTPRRDLFACRGSAIDRQRVSTAAGHGQLGQRRPLAPSANSHLQRHCVAAGVGVRRGEGGGVRGWRWWPAAAQKGGGAAGAFLLMNRLQTGSCHSGWWSSHPAARSRHIAGPATPHHTTTTLHRSLVRQCGRWTAPIHSSRPQIAPTLACPLKQHERASEQAGLCVEGDRAGTRASRMQGTGH
jgi:hypothetical protein